MKTVVLLVRRRPACEILVRRRPACENSYQKMGIAGGDARVPLKNMPVMLRTDYDEEVMRLPEAVR